MEKEESRRLIFLEAARGIASILVIFHHLASAFAPRLQQPFPIGIVNTPLYPLANGSGAVYFFFALSGFVLSASLIRRPELDALIVAIVKRLPRLALPAGVSILAGYAILAAHLNYYLRAGQISYSVWLSTFAWAEFPAGLHISLLDALRQCITVFLFSDSDYYNSNLWTMKFEFYGSLFVFISSYFAGRFVSKSNGKFVAAIVCVALPSMLFFVPYYMPFAAGATLGFIWLKHSIKVPRNYVISLFVLALALLSTSWQSAASVGAVLLLLALTQSKSAEALLSTRAGYWLGKFSFPIYLVHTLIICSAGSFVYTGTYDALHMRLPAVIAAGLVTLVLSLVAAIPLVVLENWWVPWLNRIMRASRNIVLAPTTKAETI